MKYIILLLLIPFTAAAQPSGRHNARQDAKNQLKELHNGILLVRLHTYIQKVELLKKRNLKAAERFHNDLEKMNHALVNAFSLHFNFCPVYFFYSDKSEEIKKGEWKGNLFDAGLNLADTTGIAGKKFFISEICQTESDTIAGDNSKYNYNDSAGVEKGKTFYENSNIHFLAIVIKNDHFVQLQKPFPAYVNFRFVKEFPSQRKIDAAVIQLNEELHYFLGE